MSGLTLSEWRQAQEDSCRRHLGISRQEFIDGWKAGVYHWGHDHPRHLDVASVAMMFPEVTGA